MLVGVIPARGGSVEIPQKNIADLGGKPLICWTIEAALRSKLDKVIVSTDDDTIRNYAERWGVDHVDQPHPMSLGLVNAVNVPLWTLDFHKKIYGGWPDGICMLLPTTPFTTSHDINSAIDLFQKGAPSVIGVNRSKPLECIRKVQSGVLHTVTSGSLNIQRQDVSPCYAVNGAIFLTSATDLLLKRTYHFPGAVPYVMPRLRSLDIDTLEDLEFARKILPIMMDDDE